MTTTKLFICGNLIDLSLIKSISHHTLLNNVHHRDFILITFLAGDDIEISQEEPDSNEVVRKYSDEYCKLYDEKKVELRAIHEELVKAWSGVDKSDIPVIDFKTS